MPSYTGRRRGLVNMCLLIPPQGLGYLDAPSSATRSFEWTATRHDFECRSRRAKIQQLVWGVLPPILSKDSLQTQNNEVPRVSA